MGHLRFLPKVVTVYSKKDVGFDCKNNHLRGKLTHFQLDIINKINCKKPRVILYILLGLGLGKF